LFFEILIIFFVVLSKKTPSDNEGFKPIKIIYFVDLEIL